MWSLMFGLMMRGDWFEFGSVVVWRPPPCAPVTLTLALSRGAGEGNSTLPGIASTLRFKVRANRENKRKRLGN